MEFDHAIRIRSQPGMNADYGRALERVAFFPGVTKADVISEEIDAVTIGYNGNECRTTSRLFSSDLAADDLVADGDLWEVRRKPIGSVAARAPILSENDTSRVRSHRSIAPAFDRRS